MTLDILRDHYMNWQRSAAEAQKQGRLLVGLLGIGIPTELVLAAGAFPIAVAPGARRPTPQAEAYLDELFSSLDRDLLEAAINGEFEVFDLLVLPRERQQLFYYFKELYRRGKLPKLPPLVLFDVLPSHRGVVATYNQSQFAVLKDRLEHLAGIEIGADRVRDAIVAANRVRATRRAIERFRRSGALSGSDALMAHGASAFMESDAYVDAVAALAEERVAHGAGLLVVSADTLHGLDLHRFLESCGGNVVAEDDFWGSRIGQDVPTFADPFEDIITAYLERPRSLTSYPPEHAHAWFREAIADGAVEGVVFHVPLSDLQLGWDIPHLRRLVEKCGKPWLLVHRELTGADTKARVESWIGALGHGVAANEVIT